MSDNRKIKKGISYLVIEKSVTGCITVVLLPLIIRAVGIDTFGLWGILLGLFGYILCFDIGVTVSIERYIAFYKARNDTAKLQQIFSTAFTYLILLCVLLFGIIFFGGRYILSTIIHNSSVTTNLLLLCYPGIAARTAPAAGRPSPRARPLLLPRRVRRRLRAPRTYRSLYPIP